MKQDTEPTQEQEFDRFVVLLHPLGYILVDAVTHDSALVRLSQTVAQQEGHE